MLRKYTINSTRWTAITTAGQSGTVWIKKNVRGNGIIFINHSDSGLPNRTGYRLRGSVNNNDLLTISSDNSNDVYYARVSKSKNIIEIMVDVT